MGAKVIQVIVTDLERRGKGVEGDPIRRVTQYWSLDGKLLFEYDPTNENHHFYPRVDFSVGEKQ